MPKAKAKRPAKKAARKPAKRPRATAAPKRATAAPKRAKPARARIDPRVIAAIGLALEDEAVATARAAELSQALSPWTALGRVRSVKLR